MERLGGTVPVTRKRGQCAAIVHWFVMPRRVLVKELAKLLEHDEWPQPGTADRAVGWFDVAELQLPSGALWIGDPGFSWAELAGGDGNRVTLAAGGYVVRAFV